MPKETNTNFKKTEKKNKKTDVTNKQTNRQTNHWPLANEQTNICSTEKQLHKKASNNQETDQINK